MSFEESLKKAFERYCEELANELDESAQTDKVKNVTFSKEFEEKMRCLIDGDKQDK